MRHATDGALVRWLDGECDAAERAMLSRHLGGCAGCRERLGRTRARSDRLRRALRADAPLIWGWRWRTAGIAAAGLISLAAVRPVRAWVADRAGAIWAAVVHTHEPPATANSLPVSGEGSVSFVPTGDSFVVQVQTRQHAGRLTIELRDSAVASARLTGDAVGAGLVVLPAGLRIANAPDSRASYVLELPATLQSVVLRIAGEAPVRLEPGGDNRWDVDLTARGVR